MEFSSRVKGLIFKLSLFILTFCTLLWLSVFSYAVMYYLYIPAVAHVLPVHLQYDMYCSKPGLCKFPYHNITLTETGEYELLSCGQAYAIELILDMPESENNFNQGMFMIQLEMLSKDGKLVKLSRRPAVLRFRSRLFKVVYTLFVIPALLFGTAEEKQTLSIPLFEKFVESCDDPTYFAFVEVQAKMAEVYGSSLRIHAQFTGLRYMMYYWPMLSAVIGIGSFFFSISVLVLFFGIRYLEKNPLPSIHKNLTSEEQQLVAEIRQRRRLVESSGITRQAVSADDDARGPEKKDDNNEQEDVADDDEKEDVDDAELEDIENLSRHEGFGKWSHPLGREENMPGAQRKAEMLDEMLRIIAKPSPDLRRREVAHPALGSRQKEAPA